MEEEINIQLGDYTLKKQIDKGEIIDSFIGINRRNNEMFFIKRINKSKLDSEGKTKLQRELNILDTLNKLKSNNIISKKDFLKSKNHYYLISEYCNGGNLSEYIKEYIKENKKPLNELLIQKIMSQLVTTIRYMHANKIIHRNIKLENILLNFDSHLNLAKSGKLPEELLFEDKSLNKQFTVKLTNLKNSKVLEDDSENITDLRSLGAITYELLTGLPSFDDKKSEDIIKSIQEGKFTLPNNLKFSIEIITFINGLLKFCSEKRQNLEQISDHPFLCKKPENFQYINLVILTNNEKKQIKMNSKDGDNLIWKFFKSENFDLNIEEIDQEEIKKSDVKEKIKQSVIKNLDIKKASEEEETEKKNEKKKFEDMKAKAEEEIKKAKLEKENQQKEHEKLINDENNIKNMKNNLLEKKEKEQNDSLSYTTMESFDLKLEKNNSDKEIIEEGLKNTELKINENKKILEMLKDKENENKRLNEELNKLKEQMAKKENEIKTPDKEKQTLETPKEKDSSEITIDSTMFSNCLILNKEDLKNMEKDDLSFDSNEDEIEFEDYTDNCELNVDENYIRNKFAEIKK